MKMCKRGCGLFSVVNEQVVGQFVVTEMPDFSDTSGLLSIENAVGGHDMARTILEAIHLSYGKDALCFVDTIKFAPWFLADPVFPTHFHEMLALYMESVEIARKTLPKALPIVKDKFVILSKSPVSILSGDLQQIMEEHAQKATYVPTDLFDIYSIIYDNENILARKHESLDKTSQIVYN